MAIFPRLRPESENYLHLDLMRFIAATGIVILHWGANLVEGVDRDRLHFLGLFVDLFFVISGFILAEIYETKLKDLGFVAFLRARFARLGPLHYATLLYALVLFYGAGVGKGEGACLVPTLTFTHAWGLCHGLGLNDASWSISAEMGCYLAFPLFLVAARKSPWLLLIGSALGLAALYAAHPMGWTARDWFDWTWDLGVVRALPSFGIGAALSGLRGQVIKLPFAPFVLWFLLAAWAVGGVMGVWPGHLALLIYPMVLAAIAADGQRKVAGWVAWLAPLGSLTYSLYMTHGLLGTAYKPVLRALHLHGLPRDVAILALFPVALAVAYVSLMFFERPARRWLSGRKTAKPGDQVSL